LKDGLLVNEAAVRYFEWDHPLGEQLPGSGWPENQRVIGVIKDFHFHSLHNEIRPLVLAVNPMTLLQRKGGLDIGMEHWYTVQSVLVRVRPQNMAATIERLGEVWADANPELPFDYHFIDEQNEAAYENEQRWGRIVTTASVFAVAISLLGLIGLSTLEVARRTREVGIRKVLGAGVPSLLGLLTRPLLVLVVASNLVAWPLAWWAMHRWLDLFAYKTAVTPWPLLAATSLVLLVSFEASGALAWRATRVNPVDVLQDE
jgi:putative ABC transport system permease protein